MCPRQERRGLSVPKPASVFFFGLRLDYNHDRFREPYRGFWAKTSNHCRPISGADDGGEE